MRIDILTLFPDMFRGVFDAGTAGRAVKKELLELHIHNIRDFAPPPRRTADDRPYGGGCGMVMKPEPIFLASSEIKKEAANARVILLTPQGQTFSHEKAKRLSQEMSLLLICGHYEGVDERVALDLADEELSIGDYCLSGGEIASMVIIDAVSRLIPGVLGKEGSAVNDSFYEHTLDWPNYTRPENYCGMPVPKILLSGNHADIARWRRKEALRRTLKRRADLLERAEKSAEDIKLLKEIQEEENE